MTTLYLAWQNLQNRLWFPIGRLVQHEIERGGYEFAYVRGAEQAKKLAKFREIPGFPQLYKQYLSDELFPTFRYRVMNSSRTDRPEYLRQLGIDVAKWNAITELSVSGGRSHVDNFEIFPAIEPDSEGRFRTQCILHGLRHTNQEGIEASEKLEVGDNLRLAFELNNPTTTHSLLVYTQNYSPLGWLPQYLIDCMQQENTWMVTDVNIAVAQVNLDAPLSHRLLVDLSGQLPKGFSPMQDLEQYQPISAPKRAVAAREAASD